MPIVIPAGASSSSASQVVPTSAVFDYVQNDAGVAIAGVTVTAILNGTFTTTISPQVVLNPVQIQTTTDGNGFWSLNLVPNTNISPANTTYTITIVGFRSYDITVGPSGPYQSTSLGTLVSIPATLGPATSSITGALTVSGAFSATAGATISGGLTVTGTLSLPGAALSMAGPLTLTAAASQIIPGATSLSLRNNANGADNLLVTDAGLVTARAGLVATAGGVTITAGDLAVTTGKITMAAAASQLVPGATSFSIRDTANANDNLLVSNAGNATVRGSLTVTAGPLTVTAGGETITAGNLTLTAGNLVFAAASAKIIPGATSLLVRNNADSASNLAMTDAGLATLRNALSIPPSAGGTVPTSNYGTVENLIDYQTPSAVASITVPAAGSLPTGYRHLKIKWKLKTSTAAIGENLTFRFNGSSAANYTDEYISVTNAVVTAVEDNTAPIAQGQIGFVSGTSAPANTFASGEITIFDYNSATDHKTWVFQSIGRRGTGASGFTMQQGGGAWVIAPVAVTSITIQATGNLTGVVTTEGIP